MNTNSKITDTEFAKIPQRTLSFFSLNLRKGSHKIILLKNQDSSKWWFEILISPQKRLFVSGIKNRHISSTYITDIFKQFLQENELDREINTNLPLSFPNSLKKYRRFVVGNNKERITYVLILYFQEKFKSSREDKVYLSFNNTYVEKGVSPQ